MKPTRTCEIAIIGAGIAGIAAAYFLCRKHGRTSVLLIDRVPPMSFTSAQSGDNYRNWWPHPVMTDFSNDSIDLLEELAIESSNVFSLTRRGYALATRRGNIDEHIAELDKNGTGDVRVHANTGSERYEPPIDADWQTAPDGVDVLTDRELIQKVFPSFSSEISNVIHVRRGGDFSGQQLGQFMLEAIRAAGGNYMQGHVRGIERADGFRLDVEVDDGSQMVLADSILNAAGPFANEVAAMLGTDLPIRNYFQQKLAFEDTAAVVPRDLPFSIDLDVQNLAWSNAERDALLEDPELAWLAEPIAGGVHCRPEGGRDSRWVKLGWAYNDTASSAQEDLANEPRRDDSFPEIVMRGASSLNPALRHYLDAMPTRRSHYGGYYSMTAENWPLVGPTSVDGAFVVGALSGFGSMAACGAGALSAAWLCGAPLPSYASSLSIARYDDAKLTASLRNAANKGLL